MPPVDKRTEHVALLWEAAHMDSRRALLARAGVPHRFIEACADARFLKLPEPTQQAIAGQLDPQPEARQ